MAFQLKIPAVGESITSATIGEWLKNDGDAVTTDDLVLSIETDKVSQEIPAGANGVLRIKVEEGEEVDIGAVVAEIEEGEGAPAAAAEPEGEAAPEPAEEEIEEAVEAKSEPEPESKPAPKAAPAPKAEPPRDNTDRTTRKKLSPLRRKIATQLVNAQNDAAILTTFNECDMSEVMKLRKEVQEGFVGKHGVKLGFMSFFIKACVEALKDVPSINAQIDGNEMIQNHFYDIGVAVGTEKGLIVPVVRDCDEKSFADIENSIINYAQMSRDGKIQLSDLTGGGFTISNGGVYGSLLSTPILNPPQSGILGMHTIQQRPVAIDGKVEIRPMMYLALSYDHRIVDGKEAVTFLIRVKECIENPARLLVGA